MEPLFVLAKELPAIGAAEPGSKVMGINPRTSRNGELSREGTLDTGADDDGPKCRSSGAIALAAR